MKKFHLCAAICLLGTALTSTLPALAATPEPETAARPELLGEAPAFPPSPMMLEIKAALAVSETAVAELGAQLRSAADERDALRIQRAIADAKRDAEVAVMRIQARYAREAGDVETAEKIELAVARILNPVPATPDPEAAAASAARRGGGDGHE